MERHDAEQPGIASSLYRRLPVDWWQSAKKKNTLHLIPLSFFMPKKADADGLSVSQAGISSIEVASTSARTGKRLCLAEFPTAKATDRGLTIEPKPTAHDPGHAVIPELNHLDRQDPVREAVMEEHAEAIASAATLAWTPNQLEAEPD